MWSCSITQIATSMLQVEEHFQEHFQIIFAASQIFRWLLESRHQDCKGYLALWGYYLFFFLMSFLCWMFLWYCPKIQLCPFYLQLKLILILIIEYLAILYDELKISERKVFNLSLYLSNLAIMMICFAGLHVEAKITQIVWNFQAYKGLK